MRPEPASRPAGAIARAGWILIWLLFLAATINYLDRQTLALVQPRLTAEFHFSNADYASIVSAFLVAYAIMYTLSGRIIDLLGARAGMALSIIIWSGAEMLHAVATGLTSFRIYRFLLGVGEPGMFPAAVKTVRDYFSESSRAVAFGVFNAGTSVGPAIAPPLITWVLLRYGWRAAFIATGAAGLLWLAPWLWMTRAASSVAGETNEAPHGEHPQPRVAWRSLFRHRQVWGILFGRIFADPAWYFYLFWLPPYLYKERGFSLQAIGSAGALIPYIGAAAGNVIGGWLSGGLVARGVPVIRARKLAMLATVVLMPVIFLGTRSKSDVLVVTAISLATLAHQSWSSNISTLPADAVPAGVVASVAGLAGTAGSLAGVAFTGFTGWAADRHRYGLVFLAATAIYPIGWLLVNALVREKWMADAS